MNNDVKVNILALLDAINAAIDSTQDKNTFAIVKPLLSIVYRLINEL